ncbi:hypothetical protein KGM_205564 [Danaus plexippus plexippus]|uniref:Centaurin-gamma-1A n=1 Tax=Danaus plexippus plexippus TaxID=278856 RepID=A0A212F3H4_DANPL|nr:hypothetical protein KGM_205564 [Danaus plexippus plexippus]
MCTRQHTQACLNTSLSIRQEIQRFESVHPSIYALYDLVELVPDPLLAQQIRDHVVAIEDCSGKFYKLFHHSNIQYYLFRIYKNECY